MNKQDNLFWLNAWLFKGNEAGNFLPVNVTLQPLVASVVHIRCIRWSNVRSLVTVNIICFNAKNYAQSKWSYVKSGITLKNDFPPVPLPYMSTFLQTG